MTILDLITIILFFFFFGYGLVRFFMDLTEYVAWRWQKMSEKRFKEDQIQKCWKSYTKIFGLTMSEKTLIQHFCEYLLSEVWEYDE